MFQSFDVKTDPTQSAPRVAALRARLAGNRLDGFLVPRADEHQGEYVAARAERLQWLTGFTGSAGIALILADEAVIFVDGRYALQVRDQVDLAIFTVESLVDNPPVKWLRENLSRGTRIGFDPWLHTVAETGRLRDAASEHGGTLVAVESNLVDAIWTDRPEGALGPVEIQPLEFAGEPATGKLARIAEILTAAKADHFILTDPSSIAWLFNIRGHDVPHTPLALCFALVSADANAQIFIDERKLPVKTRAYLTQLAKLMPPRDFEGVIAQLAMAESKIGLDPALAAERLRLVIEENGGRLVAMGDPAQLPRAVKNRAEIDGARAAHRRDGAAVIKFLAWLDGQPPATIDEIAAATRLEECRRTTGEEFQMPLRDVSFDTISGAGPNGAIIHYRVTTRTTRALDAGTLYLVDSGAQYEDGTTDITRTVAIGEPDDEMRQRWTLVLKGMIGISLLRFPPGTRGMDIDAVARTALWKAGLDYAHGTGHGIGSYLSVHEGPQRIAKTGTERLAPGMIVSNEPGYYREGHYGIRLENLLLTQDPQPVAGGELEMLGFETLTFVPFDRRLLRADMLTAEEAAWLDTYHARVLTEIGPLVDEATRDWLRAATAPIA